MSSPPLMPDIVEQALIAAVAGRGAITRIDHPSGTAIQVVPAAAGAAGMWFKLSPNEDEVSGTLGRNTPIEISAYAGRYTSKSGLDELALIAGSVIHEGFVERLWTQFGRVVKSRGTIRLEGRQVHIWNMSLWRIPFMSSCSESRYDPF
jgi:hypothetical protein